jgi:hypothetical protein
MVFGGHSLDLTTVTNLRFTYTLNSYINPYSLPPFPYAMQAFHVVVRHFGFWGMFSG